VRCRPGDLGRERAGRLNDDGTILSERLRLVPLAVEDAAEMAAVLADPALYRFTGGEPPTPADLERRYRAQVVGRSPDGTEAWRNWIVRLRGGGAAVGFVQATLSGEDRAADVAWVIGTSWQGRGYATEAAASMVAHLVAGGVRTVTAHVHPEHAASEGVAARIGLRPVGEVEDGERVWRLERS
jgi:RimJ/RimL family protein N-acetyltransferase